MVARAACNAPNGSMYSLTISGSQFISSNCTNSWTVTGLPSGFDYPPTHYFWSTANATSAPWLLPFAVVGEPFGKTIKLYQGGSWTTGQEIWLQCQTDPINFSELEGWEDCEATSIKINMIDFDLDMDCDGDGDMDRADEYKETSKGALIPLNRNDSNNNQVFDCDANETAATSSDDTELVPIKIELGPSVGTLKWNVISGGDKVRVWTTKKKTLLVQNGTQWAASAVPNFLYVEGIKASGSPMDIELQIEYSADNRTGVKSVKLSVVDMNISCDVDQDIDIDDDDDLSEDTSGAVVVVNRNDDNGSGVADKDDPGEVQNEDDLFKVKLSTPSISMDQIQLKVVSGSSHIKIWNNSTKSGTALSIDQNGLVSLGTTPPTELYIEGLSYSTKNGVHLEYSGKLGGQTVKDEVKLTVFDFQFITPAGDPATANGADDTVPGQNEYTYKEEAIEANTYFKIFLSVKVMPSGIAGLIANRCRFDPPSIPDSTWRFSAGADDIGTPIASGDNLTATLTYTHMPDSNSGFGLKTMKMKYASRYVKRDFIQTNFEVFFPRDGSHNPDGNVPNWFYFWRDGNVCGIESDTVLDPNLQAEGEYMRGTGLIHLNPSVATTPMGTLVSNQTVTYGNYTVNIMGDGEGISRVWLVLEHEKKHREVVETLSGTDSDGDEIPNQEESNSYCGIFSEDSMADTYGLYQLFIRLGASASDANDYKIIGDHELRCLNAERLTPSYDVSKDWANPGCNSK